MTFPLISTDVVNRPWTSTTLDFPKGKRVEVRMIDGTVHPEAHWACDLSGESQPAFRGWFVPVYDSITDRVSHYRQIDTPCEWRERES